MSVSTPSNNASHREDAGGESDENDPASDDQNGCGEEVNAGPSNSQVLFDFEGGGGGGQYP